MIEAFVIKHLSGLLEEGRKNRTISISWLKRQDPGSGI